MTDDLTLLARARAAKTALHHSGMRSCAAVVEDLIARLSYLTAPPTGVEDGAGVAPTFEGVDGQVVIAAMEGDYSKSPQWLWRNHETDVVGFGRWPKIEGAAPYVRLDIAIAASATPEEKPHD